MNILFGLLSIAAVVVTGKVTYRDMLRGGTPQYSPEAVGADN